MVFNFDRLLAPYCMVVCLISFIIVAAVYFHISNIDIGKTFKNCGASYVTVACLWASMATLSTAILMGIGYFYYSGKGEGPYGPVKAPRARKVPPRLRLLPYVANFCLITSILFPGALVTSKCKTPSEQLPVFVTPADREIPKPQLGPDSEK